MGETRERRTVSQLLQDDAERLATQSLFKRIKLPWEKGPLSAIFSPDTFGKSSWSLDPSWVGLQDGSSLKNIESMPQVQPALQQRQHASARKKVASNIITLDDMRHRSLVLIRVIVEADPSSTDLGTQLSMYRAADNMEMYWSTLEDTFASRASATLYKRCNSMWAFFMWLKASGRPVRFTEQHVYEYLVFAKSKGKAPSHGAAFLQSVHFFHATCKFTEMDPSSFSGRIKGAVDAMLQNRRPLQQARPLYTQELKALEDTVLDPEEQDHIRIIAGYLLFCLLACCRFSDPMYAVEWEVSSHSNTTIIEAKTRIHKTARQGRQFMFLPLVALGKVYSCSSWAKAWNDLRLLVLSDAKCTLPTFSEQTGVFLSRAMVAGEATLWLRDIVGAKCQTAQSLSTHSLKCTLLTWISISGLLSLDQRRALGHHMDPGSKSPLCYSRHEMINLQTQVGQLLRMIVSVTLDPELPRVAQLDIQINRLVEQVAEHDASVVAVVPSANIVEDGGVSDGSEAIGAEELESQADDADVDTVEVDISKAAGLVTQHKASGVLHFISSPTRLLCGRPCNEAYATLEDDMLLKWPLCRQCRRRGGDDFVDSVSL